MNNADILTAPTTELINAYREAAIAYGEAIANGRHRVANRSHALLVEIRKELSNRGTESGASLTSLLRDEQPAVRLWAAAHSAEHARDAAVETLEALIADPPSPLRLMAEIALTEARKQKLP